MGVKEVVGSRECGSRSSGGQGGGGVWGWEGSRG